MRQHHEIEALDGWNWSQRVEETIHRLHLDPEAVIGTLSGGTGPGAGRPTCCCSTSPPLALVVEDLLIDFKGSVVAITHDRSFLDRVATRIVELDRGILRAYPGNFSQYLVLKEEQLAQEAVINAKADKLLAQEEILDPQWAPAPARSRPRRTPNTASVTSPAQRQDRGRTHRRVQVLRRPARATF